MMHATALTGSAAERTTFAGTWSGKLLHLLVASGAITVITGSYMTWATFYGGLIARDGVAGHGRYFIGLAIAAIVASMLAGKSGVSQALRWLPALAGAGIAAYAYRDLRNLDALIGDPASGFYLPGRGDGLTVVIVGAVILIAAPFAARTLELLQPARTLPTAAAIATVAAVALAVPGIYGMYFDVSSPTVESSSYGRDAQLLLLAAAISAATAIQLWMLSLRRRGAAEAVNG